jgi:hypothetical protein
VHSGQQAFRFSGKSSGPYVQQDVATAAGQALSVSGWVNVPTSKSTGAVVELLALNAGKGTISTWTLYAIPTSTAGWVSFAASRPMLSATAYARLRIKVMALDGTIYIDDLSIAAASVGTATPTTTPTETATLTPTDVPAETPTSTSSPTKTVAD